MNSKPSLIYSDTNFDTFESRLLKISTLNIDYFTDGITTIQDGVINNLTDPVNLQDAATKNYVDGVTPGGIEGAVQYNDGRIFGGTSNFIFDTNTKTLFVNGTITDGVSSWNSGIISNLNDAVSLQDLATKNDVDIFNNFVESTIVSGSTITYNAEQMINGIIYRDPETVGIGPYIDFTADAVDIISFMPSSAVGTTVTCYIKNITNDTDVFVYLRPGTGVSFTQPTPPVEVSITIPKDYILKSKLIITSPTTVLMLVESVEYGESVSDIITYQGSELYSTTGAEGPRNVTVGYSGITANFLKIEETIFSGFLGPLVIQNSPGNVVINPSNIIDQQTFLTSSDNVSGITVSFIGPASETVFSNTGYTRNGGFKFILRNGSRFYKNTLIASSGFIMDPNSNMVIGPNQNGIFWGQIDSDSETVTIYTIGIVNRDAFQWILRTTPTQVIGTTWNSVEWSPALSLFVAVGSGGSAIDGLMTSPDGTNWSIGTVPITNDWVSIVWAPELGLFVAVSSSGTTADIMTSIDGGTWESQTTPTDGLWSHIEWSPSLSLFLVVSETNLKVMTSSDGVTWVTSTPVTPVHMTSVIWAPEISLFCGCSSTFVPSIFTSPDGLIWTSQTSSLGSLTDITWSPELTLFCAVSSNGDPTTSPDGISWTTRTPVVSSSGTFSSVTWSSELNMFVSLQNIDNVTYPGSQATYSYDGASWDWLGNTPVNNVWQDIVWSKELQIFVAISQDGLENKVMTGGLSTYNYV